MTHRAAVIRSFVAAVVMTAVMAALRFTLHGPLLPEIATDALSGMVSPDQFRFFVHTLGLGLAAKPLAFAAMVVLHLMITTAIGWGALDWASHYRSHRAYSRILAVAFVAGIVASLNVAPIVGPGVFGGLRGTSAEATGYLLLEFIIFGALLVLVFRPRASAPVAPAGASSAPSGGGERREVMRTLALVAVVAGAAASALGLLRVVVRAAVALAQDIFASIPGLSPEVTPNEKFYTISKNTFDPQVPLEKWRLKIGGLVGKEITITYDQLKALPAIEQYATLICVSNEVGGDLVGNAKWKGVALATLFDMAGGVKPGAVDLVLKAHDGYTDSFPIGKALSPGTILAYEMNGQVLPHAHGYPARVVVPGIYGMKNVKWLTELEVVAEDFKGFWARRGWSDTAIIRTMSRIDVPASRGTLTRDGMIAGIAFAGDRGISEVQVSADNGQTWVPAQVKGALSPYTWVLWAVPWAALRRGLPRAQVTVLVRARDKNGASQVATEAPPLPDGATGLHRVTARLG